MRNIFVQTTGEEKAEIDAIKEEYNLKHKDIFRFGIAYLKEYKEKCLFDLHSKGYFDAYVKLTHRYYKNSEGESVKEFRPTQVHLFEPTIVPTGQNKVLKVKVLHLEPRYKGKSIMMKYSFVHEGRVETVLSSVNRKESDGAISWIMENQ
jgi:hypothetical protein